MTMTNDTGSRTAEEASSQSGAGDTSLETLCERLLPLLDRELGRLAREGRYGA